MKKVPFTLSVAGMFAFVACSPSAEEKAAQEKAYQDSVAAAQQSANSAMAADSMQKAMSDTGKMNMDTMAK